MMKTTTKEFERFKKAFLKAVDNFGLKEYRIIFYRESLQASDCYAEIHIDEDGKTADVSFTTEFRNSGKEGYKGPEAHAKHEAIHLLLAKIIYLAQWRYIRYQEIELEEERLVRILEKLL